MSSDVVREVTMNVGVVVVRNGSALDWCAPAEYKYLIVNKMAQVCCCCREGSTTPVSTGPAPRIDLLN